MKKIHSGVRCKGAGGGGGGSSILACESNTRVNLEGEGGGGGGGEKCLPVSYLFAGRKRPVTK